MSAPRFRVKCETKITPLGKKVWEQLRILDKGPYIKVGALATSGQHKGSVSISMVDVASFAEYGFTAADGSFVGPRSFIASTLFARKEDLKKLVQDQVKLIFDGQRTVEEVMDLIGTQVVAWIKDHIIQGDYSWPPLKESTIIKKGSGQELIDTGQLLASINYEKVMTKHG